jgi:hypothetical protein
MSNAVSTLSSSGSKRIVAAMAAFVGLSGCASSWQSLAPPDGHFQVAMKGKVEQNTTEQPLPSGGVLRVRQWSTTLDDTKRTFVVVVVDASGAADFNVAGGVDSILAGIVRRSRGTLGEQKDAELAGQLAKEYAVDVQAPRMQYRIRTLLHGPVAYLLSFSHPGDQDADADGDHFFGSFQVR